MKKIITVFIIFFNALLTLKVTAQTYDAPSWINDINFYLKVGFDVHLPLKPTVVGWGVNIFQDSSAIQWSNQNDIIHIEGQNLQFLWLDLPEEIENAYCVNIYDEPMLILNQWKFLNLADSNYQNWIKDNIKFQIDMGSDGIMFDSPDAISRALWEGGTFDEINMMGFRNYLRENYTIGQLQSLYNINDIDNFNYRDYLVSHNLIDSYINDPKNTILWKDYDNYIAKQVRSIISELAQYAKAYAKNNYNKDISFSTNSYNMLPTLIYAGQENDYFSIEHPYLGESTGYDGTQDPDDILLSDLEFPPRNKSVTNIKLAKSIYNKMPSLIPHAGNFAGFRKVGVNSSIELYKLFITEAYVNGGAFVYHLPWGPGESEYTSEVDVEFMIAQLKSYNEFILDHQYAYYTEIFNLETAILYSQPSVYNAWGVKEYNGTCDLLIENNIPFEVIFSSFTHNDIYGYSPPIVLDGNTLSKYKLIILPNTQYLTNNDVTTILEYIASGGTVLAWCSSGESIGEYDEEGTVILRSDLKSMSKSGTHSYGDGKLIFLEGDIGSQYNEYRDTSDLRQINEIISSIIPPTIISNTPSTINVFCNSSKNGSIIFNHILNYNYDVDLGYIVPFDSAEISIKIDENFDTSAIQVYCESPDISDNQLLDYELKGNYLKYVVPKINIYNLVSITSNSASPVITNYYPKNDTTIVEKDTLQFLVNVNDSDDNPLYYNWTVDGVIDTTSNSNTFQLITNYSSAGEILVSVNIRDGRYNVSKDWTIEILDGVIPRILFDESHDEKNTISLEYALELEPDHPEWYYFGTFKDEITQLEYELIRHVEGELNSELLSSYHLLIFAAPQSQLSNNEIDALLSFLNNGGACIIMSDADGLPTSFDTLTKNFGLTFDKLPIASLNGTWDNQSFWVTGIQTHPITNHVNAIHTNWATRLNLDSNSTSLIITNDSTWIDRNFNNIKDEQEETGPFSVIAYSEYGDGKIVGIGDNAFHDSMIFYGDNKKLLINAVNFLVSDITTDIKEINSNNIPMRFSLRQNYPNPFNPTTNISYSIPESGEVFLIVYDILGRKVATLVNEEKLPGNYSIDFNGHHLSSGVYFYQLRVNDFVETKKMVMLR